VTGNSNNSSEDFSDSSFGGGGVGVGVGGGDSSELTLSSDGFRTEDLTMDYACSVEVDRLVSYSFI